MLSYKKIYTVNHKLSAIFMIVALLWLTISAPFVFAAWQKMAKASKMEQQQPPLADAEEDANPLSNNNTEEKAPSSNTFSEEFLHEQMENHCFFSITSAYTKHADASTYVAFHGELLVPPPNCL